METDALPTELHSCTIQRRISLPDQSARLNRKRGQGQAGFCAGGGFRVKICVETSAMSIMVKKRQIPVYRLTKGAVYSVACKPIQPLLVGQGQLESKVS
ncbi:MAG: hypothetical protein ABJI14_03700 [Marinomonas sp.]